MTSLAASADFRRSNHERSHSESSVWIDEYLNDGLNAEDLLDVHLKNGGLNLLAPFENDDDLQSALSQYMPDCAFSEFEGVEPVDVTTMEDDKQLVECTTPQDSPTSSTCTTELRVPVPQSGLNKTDQATSANVSCDPMLSHKSAFAQPSLPAERRNKTISPRKAQIASPSKWFGAHPLPKDAPEASSQNKSKPKSSNVDTAEKVRLEGVLVRSPHQGKPNLKQQKIVSQALLDKLKAATKKATRQSILISAPVSQQLANRCLVSLDHDYCVDLRKGEKDDLEVQPMELEPEHERAVARIEVLPDLSLAARETRAVPASSASPGVGPHGHEEYLSTGNEFEEVVCEEVVTSAETGSASSDSGVESFVRPEEDDSEGGLRRLWKDERPPRNRSRRSSRSSSDSSSIASDGGSGIPIGRRNRRRSSSRRRDFRSRSPSPRRSYGSKRRRNYSRDSSPESNSGSDDRRSRGERSSSVAERAGGKAVRRERKNIWATPEMPKTFPHMPPLNKPGQKTIMQSALEQIERGGGRQVLYVGQIQEGTTRSYIREKFDRFGPIAEVSLHFRETGENYAFVTFHQPKDAYFALDNAALLPDFKLCFGGRRQFCGRKWSDLDNEQERAYLNAGSNDLDRKHNDFDSLLNELKTASMRK